MLGRRTWVGRTKSDITEVETPYVLETLSPIATSNDDHHVLHKISGMIAARGGPFAPIDDELFPLDPIERTTDVESPDVVQRLQPISATEHPNFVLVQHGRVRTSWRGDLSPGDGRARPAPCGYVEDVHAVIVRGVLAPTD